MLTDLRLALRSLTRARGFALVALLSLAVGLGATTTVFSLVDALAFRPLPFPEADRLMDVHETSATRLCAGCGVGTSWEGYTDWRAARAFDAMAAYAEEPFVLAPAGAGVAGAVPNAAERAAGAERVQGARASAGLFALLGVRPVLGRTFAPDEDRVGAERVVVLGNDLWRRRFGADSAVVGRVIPVSGVPHTVIGVLPPRFRFPEFADLYVPIGARPPRGGRDDRNVGVVARLRAGVTREAARAEMATIGRRLGAEHPETQAEWTVAVTPLREDMAGAEVRLGWALLGAVVLVQLVVCANLAGLLLARAAARRRELAVRAALGAGRGRLARHVLAESGLLAAGGAVAGFTAAAWALETIARLADREIPYWIEIRTDARVAAFCVALAALTALVVGLGVALRAARPDVQGALKDAGPNASATRRQGRARAALVVGELAAALVLLAGAGLMIKTLARVAGPSDDADAARVVTAQLPLLDARYADPAQIARAAAALDERLARLPGADAAALQHAEFLAGFGGADVPVTLDGGRAAPAGASPRFAFAVTPGWRALRGEGRRLVAGRDLSADDRAGAPVVALVNESAARRLWPDASPLGQRVKLGAPDADRPWVTVVGVVADPHGDAGGRVRSEVWVPLAQWPGRPLELSVRARGADGAAIVPALRQAAAQALPGEPLEEIQTAAAAVRARFRPVRLIAQTLAALAAFAVGLAALGVYGVVAYAAATRTREIGVRVALGATPRDVLRLFGGQGARLALLGAAVGLAGAAAGTRALGAMLFGTNPLDPAVLLAVTALLAIVAMVASWLPARRAARVDPAAALRSE